MRRDLSAVSLKPMFICICICICMYSVGRADMCEGLYQSPALLPDKVVVSSKSFLTSNISDANIFKLQIFQLQIFFSFEYFSFKSFLTFKIFFCLKGAPRSKDAQLDVFIFANLRLKRESKAYAPVTVHCSSKTDPAP